MEVEKWLLDVFEFICSVRCYTSFAKLEHVKTLQRQNYNLFIIFCCLLVKYEEVKSDNNKINIATDWNSIAPCSTLAIYSSKLWPNLKAGPNLGRIGLKAVRIRLTETKKSDEIKTRQRFGTNKFGLR